MVQNKVLAKVPAVQNKARPVSGPGVERGK